MTDEKIRELLGRQPTPLYLFDEAVLRDRVAYLRKSLPERVELCYAVKANTFIPGLIEDLVDYYEICSPGEYRICDKAGLAHSKFVISGVNKEAEFIGSIAASRDPIAYFTAESLRQFQLLRRSAEKAGRRLTVLLRLTGGNQFGLDQEDLCGLVERYKEDAWIDIAGIQLFTGTQKYSLKKARRELARLDQLIEDLQQRYDFKIRKLEYGPGFPVTYFEGETFDEDAYLQEFSQLLEDMSYQGRVSLELGRSIAASCGTYLTRVVDTKCNKGELYAIVDGGMHQLVYYGQSMAMKHPVIRLLADHPAADQSTSAENPSPEGLQDWNICGSLCTVNDYLVKRFPLPGLEVGDILAFAHTGAYSVTEGIALFLSRELPGVVLLHEDGSFETLRKQIRTELFNGPQSQL